MSKEEKAKEYSKKICAKSCRSQCEVYDLCTIYKERIKNYLAGYTQAEQDLSTQLTAYKEALRHLVNLCDADSADEVIFYQMEHNIDLDMVLSKAKQLLKTQENEKD